MRLLKYVSHVQNKTGQMIHQFRDRWKKYIPKQVNVEIMVWGRVGEIRLGSASSIRIYATTPCQRRF